MIYSIINNNSNINNAYATNLVTSLNTISPENRFMIENKILSAGVNNLGFPHPSYAILYEFKSLPTCNTDCNSSKLKQSNPVAYNCLILDENKN